MHALDSPAAVREALRAIAGNLSFTWLPGARALFEDLDPERFAALDHNPTALIAELSDEQLARATTEEYLERPRARPRGRRRRDGAPDLVAAPR